MKYHEVPARLLPELWPFAKPFLERAMAYHPFMDTDDLLQTLLAGKAQLSVLADEGRIVAALALQIVEYPKVKTALILALGGETNTFKRRYSDATNEYLSLWGKTRGCRILHTYSRPGFERLALKHGGQCQSVVLAWKELD